MPLFIKIKRQIPVLSFVLFLTANLFFWFESHKVSASWGNVPPVPSQEKASFMALGDNQLAYRVYAMMLQNLGNVGGRIISLQDYNYARLQDWFFLEDYLDRRSDSVPLLAANYFGAVDDNDKLNHVLDYLAVIGARPEGEKWRWLGHAVFLAKHQQKDNQRALELAYKLSKNSNPDLAPWAKQMPAFILQEEGQSELAYKIMLNILISNVDNMHPNEIYFMKDYICKQLVVELDSIKSPDFCLSY